jgi:lysyl-tRNA synthetase class 2
MKPSIAKASPWWTPSVHADRRPFLIGRNAIQAALRGYFAGEDFIEVDTATLQVSPGNEAHLHAFAHRGADHDGQGAASICTPRRNSPARSCWPPARQNLLLRHVYRNRERGRCTIPNSPCSNGTVPAKAMRA